MVAKAAVIGSKRGKRRMVSLLCILTAQVLLLGVLARCGDGEWIMTPGGSAAYTPAS